MAGQQLSQAEGEALGKRRGSAHHFTMIGRL